MNFRLMFSGSYCAGVVSAGVACFYIGFSLFLAGILDAMDIVNSKPNLPDFSVPLVILAVIIWLWGWYFLHIVWKSKKIRRSWAYQTAVVLIVAGVTGTLLSVIGQTL